MVQPPDFVNDKGVKWWREDTITAHAKARGLQGIQAWRIEETSGTQSYVLTEGDEVIYSSQQLDAVGVHLDLLYLIRRTS